MTEFCVASSVDFNREETTRHDFNKSFVRGVRSDIICTHKEHIRGEEHFFNGILVTEVQFI